MFDLLSITISQFWFFWFHGCCCFVWEGYFIPFYFPWCHSRVNACSYFTVFKFVIVKLHPDLMHKAVISDSCTLSGTETKYNPCSWSLFWYVSLSFSLSSLSLSPHPQSLLQVKNAIWFQIAFFFSSAIPYLVLIRHTNIIMIITITLYAVLKIYFVIAIRIRCFDRVKYRQLLPDKNKRH